MYIDHMRSLSRIFNKCIFTIHKMHNDVKRLSPVNREFFALVTDAAFANPFSEVRRNLDRQLAHTTPGHQCENELESALANVAARVAQLESEKAANLKAYNAEDQGILRNAFLFEVFHRYLKEFDRLILEQIAASESSCPVAFAGEALALLTKRGFSVEESNRYFAVFYQLRRAFYFISRSLVGNSRSIRQLKVRLWNNVFTWDIRLYESFLWNRMEDFSTLLLGETGTGKGAAAIAIGRSGFIPFDLRQGCFRESFMRSFVAMNLSQYPETLIESELFGHIKGAFTGAIAPHEGILARCSPHGSIFLDEIGDLSIPVQIKLLQVLQERVFSPVGSHDKRRFAGRIIAATNKSLDAMRRAGAFRDDFYYRLCSDVIVVPPLRQRLEEDAGELKLLIGHLLQRMLGVASRDLTTELCESLQGDPGPCYAWPGNVRELEQAVRRILLTRTYEGDAVSVSAGFYSRILGGVDSGTMPAQELLSNYCSLLYERYGTYEAVAQRTGLDRRTVKKYIVKPDTTGKK
jgi:DNA-binding NtrC family response regulator